LRPRNAAAGSLGVFPGFCTTGTFLAMSAAGRALDETKRPSDSLRVARVIPAWWPGCVLKQETLVSSGPMGEDIQPKGEDIQPLSTVELALSQ
jgi:hypothetical protein